MTVVWQSDRRSLNDLLRRLLLTSLVLCLAPLAGCQSGHSARNRAINQGVADSFDPAKRQQITGVAFRLPDEPGWRIRAHEAHWFSAIRTIAQDHTAAVHVERKYPHTTDYPTPEDFLKVLDNSLRPLVPGELELLAFESKLTPSMGPYCVKYMKRTKAIIEGRPAGSLYQLHGFGCRHPVEPNLFLDIAYSEFSPPGPKSESEIAARAERFFSKIDFVAPNLKGSYKEPGFVGLELTKNPNAEYVEVVRSIQGFDAKRQGIQTGDRIVEVDGLDVRGRELPDVVNRLRGDAGTKVQLVISRNDPKGMLRLNLMRLPSRQ